ncbi:MAG: DUF3014 domain-containing protein [Thermodesulfobacteriota bacterium]|nr:DUF3014 domain-containing protein [Thermodesulfobacteriota bacterium]
MNKTNLVILILIALLSALGLSFYLQNKPASEHLIQDIQPTLPPEPIKTPIVHYPVPESVTEQPALPLEQDDLKIAVKNLSLPETLPAIQESDQSILDALKSLISGKTIYQLLYTENFIQKFVATIDNLPEKRLPRALLPIKAPEGKFLIAGTTEAPQTSSRNFKRYTPYVTFLESIDQNLTIKLYTFFYPLFQTAYEQLGYKNAYFNDRLVYVIDHLLDTPNPPDPLQLAQPAVLYTYANPLLENLSSGQKILLRIGQDQRLRTLKILESYRNYLTNFQP